MPNLDRNAVRALKGKLLVGTDGDLGRITELYVDNTDGDPTFATVDTGGFAGRSSFVPLAGATLSGDSVRVPYDRDLVQRAPGIDPDAELTPEEEERLYAHYGVHAGMQALSETGTGSYSDSSGRGAVGYDTSGPETDDAMTRSEERLRVGTQQFEAGRARLRKYVVAETQTATVPVSHEELVVERQPITDVSASVAYDGPVLAEEEHEIVLTEERPIVEKETVPVERVRLDTEVVTENVQVSEEVRKEQIEVEGDVEVPSTDRGLR